MKREELINLVKKIELTDIPAKEMMKIVEIFKKNVLDPKASDYIFAKEYEHLSAEEIVDKALSYESIKLPESFE